MSPTSPKGSSIPTTAQAKVLTMATDVRKLHDGQSVDDGLLIKRELNGKEYRQLLNRLAEDYELQEYIRDKLR
jgi:hypothetical protein